jgi:hypothetical protein
VFSNGILTLWVLIYGYKNRGGVPMEDELISTIEQAKALITEKKYKECEALICAAMFEHPHDAIPHNLMGLLLENEDSHVDAMKHFRAAYALDPTYRPSSWNLECFGNFTMPHSCAYSASDCEDHFEKKQKGGNA